MTSFKDAPNNCSRCKIKRKRPFLYYGLFCMPPNTLYIASKLIQIQWGQDNEQVACQMYISHMKRNGCSDLCVHKCRFIIYSKLGWLYASPDGRVTDPSSQHANGIV